MIVNGRVMDKHYPTIADLLLDLHLDSSKVVVEVNMNIVPRSSYAIHSLTDSDSIEVVSFVGGG